jgi:hypothetical protein
MRALLSQLVIAGLDPAIPLRRATPEPPCRDGRDKPGHDGKGVA